jgi:hypothetical protein
LQTCTISNFWKLYAYEMNTNYNIEVVAMLPSVLLRHYTATHFLYKNAETEETVSEVDNERGK